MQPSKSHVAPVTNQTRRAVATPPICATSFEQCDRTVRVHATHCRTTDRIDRVDTGRSG